MSTLHAYDAWKTRAPEHDDVDTDVEEPELEPTDEPLFQAGPVAVFLLDDGRHLVSVESRHPCYDDLGLPTVYEEVEVADETTARSLAVVLSRLAAEWCALRGLALFAAAARYCRWMEADEAAHLDTCLPAARAFVEAGVMLSRERAEVFERAARPWVGPREPQPACGISDCILPRHDNEAHSYCCASALCPGRPWRASVYPHPSPCAP